MEVFINKKFIFASRDPEEKVLKKATVAHLAFNKKMTMTINLGGGRGDEVDLNEPIFKSSNALGLPQG